VAAAAVVDMAAVAAVARTVGKLRTLENKKEAVWKVVPDGLFAHSVLRNTEFRANHPVCMAKDPEVKS
jgi:hypothetical protein